MGAQGHAPGRYSAEYTPSSALSRTLRWINISALRWPWFLWLLQTAVGLPLSLLYMLALGPIEVLLTAFRNKRTENRLAISRHEDAKFVLVGFIVPVVVWIIVGVLWLA